jgi:hypothetical protein
MSTVLDAVENAMLKRETRPVPVLLNFPGYIQFIRPLEIAYDDRLARIRANHLDPVPAKEESLLKHANCASARIQPK